MLSIATQASSFAGRHGRTLTVDGATWRYYRLGTGAPVLWLTGGLRRAALGFAFLEGLAATRTVIAPDYPAEVRTIGEFNVAFDAILEAERIESVALVGQSYGGLLAQAYLVHRPEAIERIILSSTGPADYRKAWLPVEYAAMGLARVLPELTAKKLLVRGLLGAISLPEAQRAEWSAAIAGVVRDQLTRADVISHFAVAADLIRRGSVGPAALRDWHGRIVVLSAENDPTQSRKDVPRWERLFGRRVEVISLGDLGHAAVLTGPAAYAAVLAGALE